jgi:hypothetical protein
MAEMKSARDTVPQGRAEVNDAVRPAAAGSRREIMGPQPRCESQAAILSLTDSPPESMRSSSSNAGLLRYD